jgi:double-strand break repair protein MRE11
VAQKLTNLSHAYTETGYLPENFLPEFVDLVVWGHEHECLIDPRYNPEMGFHVMQPGSSVATSLMPGEAVPKHVAILNITGKEFTSESIRLRSVRPFIMKEIVLADERAIKEKQLWKMTENRTKITQHLMEIVDELIETAKREWLELQDDRDQDDEVPLPLVRLRVEYTAPENGTFHVENPQRFSNRFTKKVANTNDVVQFYRKKQTASRELCNPIRYCEVLMLEQEKPRSTPSCQMSRSWISSHSIT